MWWRKQASKIKWIWSQWTTPQYEQLVRRQLPIRHLDPELFLAQPVTTLCLRQFNAYNATIQEYNQYLERLIERLKNNTIHNSGVDFGRIVTAEEFIVSFSGSLDASRRQLARFKLLALEFTAEYAQVELSRVGIAGHNSRSMANFHAHILELCQILLDISHD